MSDRALRERVAGLECELANLKRSRAQWIDAHKAGVKRAEDAERQLAEATAETCLLSQQLAESRDVLAAVRGPHAAIIRELKADNAKLYLKNEDTEDALSAAVQAKGEATAEKLKLENEVDLLTQVIEKAVMLQDGTGEVTYGEYDEGRYCPTQELPNIPALEIEVGRLREALERIHRGTVESTEPLLLSVARIAEEALAAGGQEAPQ